MKYILVRDIDIKFSEYLNLIYYIQDDGIMINPLHNVCLGVVFFMLIINLFHLEI